MNEAAFKIVRKVQDKELPAERGLSELIAIGITPDLARSMLDIGPLPPPPLDGGGAG